VTAAAAEERTETAALTIGNFVVNSLLGDTKYKVFRIKFWTP
jgi:hypothetical protein